MVDCHIHMVLDGVNWKDAIARHKAAPQEALIRQTLGHYQALGFSYLRDGGDRWGVCDLAAIFFHLKILVYVKQFVIRA